MRLDNGTPQHSSSLPRSFQQRNVSPLNGLLIHKKQNNCKHLFKGSGKLTMIERLIENWLTNLSERKDLDIPFRLLLEAEGHRVNGHRTIHGPMELGKDVVSWYPRERCYYFFQLKSGDATQNDWVEMERQMLLMAEVPYVHPNYQPGDPYQTEWVCTGQLHE